MAAQQMTLKFRGLKQQHSFYYSSQCCRSASGKASDGWFWLWDSTVRWWLEPKQWRLQPEQQSARSWLSILFLPCGLRASPSALCSWTSVGFLTTWWPQHSRTAYMTAEDFKREAKPNGSYITFYELAQKAHRSTFASFYFVSASEPQTFLESRGREFHLWIGDRQGSRNTYNQGDIVGAIFGQQNQSQPLKTFL